MGVPTFNRFHDEPDSPFYEAPGMSPEDTWDEIVRGMEADAYAPPQQPNVPPNETLGDGSRGSDHAGAFPSIPWAKSGAGSLPSSSRIVGDARLLVVRLSNQGGQIRRISSDGG